MDHGAHSLGRPSAEANAFDVTAFGAPALGHQRSHGEAMVGLSQHQGRTVLTDLRQKGSAKAILPHSDTCSPPCPEVVFLNTSGGLTGGDRLSWRLDLGPKTRAIATSQTAERAYRSKAGSPPALVDITLNVGAGGWLDWLPQETILFDQSHLSRRTQITLGPGAGCLILEAVVLGRSAMGETISDLRFSDHREIRRQLAPAPEGGGPLYQPLWLEPLSLDRASLTAGSATLGGARAFASLTMVGPGVADALPALRQSLKEMGVEAAASAFEGKLTCRMRARDAWPMRRQIQRALAVLRQNPLPRVWQTLERQQ